MSNDSTKKTLIVALGVCLVCSILVSSAAVSLHGIQQENKKLDKLKNILIAGDLYKDNIDVTQTYKDLVRGEIIDMKTGEPIPESDYNDELNVEKFDIKAMAEDSEYGKSIPAEKDIADIKRMPKYMTVYQVIKDGELDEVILPIYGFGLWSTMYGFIAIDHDVKTIRGLTFYEHGETPGLGGEIDNPNWKAIWPGKQAFDDKGNVKITVIKSNVDKSSPDAKYQVDGLSGATLTTRGLDNTVKFWLGKDGYGPYIEQLREGLK